MSQRGTRVCVAATVAVTLWLFTGAHGQQRLCPEGPCIPDDPRPRPPTQYVSPPDMALQLSQCVSSPVAAFVIGVLGEKLADAMRDLDTNDDDPPPQPEVRHACANGRSTFGGWLGAVGSYGTTDTATARNVGLGTVAALRAGETFAFAFRPSGMARLVRIRWADQPRRLDGDGRPDPHGSVTLHGWSLAFEQGSDGRSTVDLAIDGTYDGIQDTDFRLHVYDFLNAADYGQLACETWAEADPTETTIDSVLDTLTGGTAGSSLGDVVGVGPGCKITGLLPYTVLLPALPGSPPDAPRYKAVFGYTRVGSSNASGLTFAGTWELRERQPYVTIGGPVGIHVAEGQQIEATFSSRPRDLRPPLSVSWTSLDAAPRSGPDLTRTTMVWNIPGLDVGEEVTRNVRVSVTDADGVAATAYRGIHIARVLEDDDTSAFCQSHPSHPQCPGP